MWFSVPVPSGVPGEAASDDSRPPSQGSSKAIHEVQFSEKQRANRGYATLLLQVGEVEL